MNSIEKPPDTVVFFLNENLGTKQVATALRLAGAMVEIHTDHFPPGEEDEDWLPEVGKRGWIVLTKDDKIRYRTPERIALVKAGVALFALASGNLRGEEMAQAFVKALPRMQQFLAKYHPPFIARVTRNGAVSMVLKSTEL